jgi:zinc D-Ala-D-Ala dipeptidase
VVAALALASPAPARYRDTPLVNVQAFGPTIALDMRYATADNFTGRRLPGYCEQRALMLRRPAKALARVQERLERDGLGLKLFDAYRPARATRAMVRWAERTGRQELLGTYIARRSNHNRGVAVDVTPVRLSSGRQLDMGTAYDAFSARSHTENARGAALRNRLRLRSAMSAEGFANYRREWWHYDFPGDGRAYNVTIGC